MRDSPAATHTMVDASNLLMGHGLLLRLAALADPPEDATEERQAAQPQQRQQQQAEAPRSPASDVGVAAAGWPLDAEPSSLEAFSTATEQLLLRSSASSLGSACSQLESAAEVEAAGQQGAAAAIGTPGLAAAPLPEPSAASAALAAPAAPAKLALTSVQLADCRVVLRYQPALHLGGVGGEGVPGAGIPAAVHDFLGAHQDLLALDVPLLHLRLPLDPAGLAAAAAWDAEEQEQAGGTAGQGTVPAPPSTSSSAEQSAANGAAAGRSESSSPGSGCSVGGSWGGWPAAAAATHASPELTFRQRGAGEQPDRQLRPGRMLLEASQLSLLGAAVGHGRHPMLPLLQLPGVHLACTVGEASGHLAAGSPRSSCGPSGSGQGSPPRRSSRSSPLATDAGRPSHRRLKPGVACQSIVPPAPCIAYRLDVASLDLGLHPSQLSMLTSALQLCQHELAVLGREPADGLAAGDADSVITSTSAPTEQLAPSQQQQQQQGLPAVQAGPAGSEAAATAAGADLDSALGRAQQAAAASPAGHAAPPARADVASRQQWQLEASVRCVGLSLLGATPSSSCLKLEWHDVAASCRSGASWQHAVPASPAAASPQRHAPLVASPSASHASAPVQGDGGPPWVELEAELSWLQLSLHVLHPRLPYMHAGATPFAFAAGVLAEGRGRRVPGASALLHASRTSAVYVSGERPWWLVSEQGPLLTCTPFFPTAPLSLAAATVLPVPPRALRRPAAPSTLPQTRSSSAREATWAPPAPAWVACAATCRQGWAWRVCGKRLRCLFFNSARCARKVAGKARPLVLLPLAAPPASHSPFTLHERLTCTPH